MIGQKKLISSAWLWIGKSNLISPSGNKSCKRVSDIDPFEICWIIESFDNLKFCLGLTLFFGDLREAVELIIETWMVKRFGRSFSVILQNGQNSLPVWSRCLWDCTHYQLVLVVIEHVCQRTNSKVQIGYCHCLRFSSTFWEKRLKVWSIYNVPSNSYNYV